MASGQSVPQRHVDGRNRHGHESLQTEESKSLRKLVRQFSRREQLTLYDWLKILDEISGWFQGSDRVREYHAVSDCAVVRDDIGQDQWRFGDGSTRRLVRLCHRHAHGTNAKLANLWTRHKARRIYPPYYKQQFAQRARDHPVRADGRSCAEMIAPKR